jgi:hypothetical protein
VKTYRFPRFTGKRGGKKLWKIDDLSTTYYDIKPDEIQEKGDIC